MMKDRDFGIFQPPQIEPTFALAEFVLKSGSNAPSVGKESRESVQSGTTHGNLIFPIAHFRKCVRFSFRYEQAIPLEITRPTRFGGDVAIDRTLERIAGC